MNPTLISLLITIAEILQAHSDRLKSLEEGESAEDSDDATLMEEIGALLAELQPPASVPSDQM